VAAADTTIQVEMGDAGVEKTSWTGGTDEVEGGEDVVFGAAVEAAVVWKDGVDEMSGAEVIGITDFSQVELNISTTFEGPLPLLPPAKIARQRFDSDVAASSDRAWLRAAVLHVPELTLKMSTKVLPTQSMIQRRQSTWKTTHTQTYPTKQRKLQGKSTQTSREDCDPQIRQRCGSKIESLFAQSHCVPSPIIHVQNTNSVRASK
jgi:hypothetical protein